MPSHALGDRIRPEDLFGADEIERGRRYHRPLYAVFALGVVLTLAALALLAGPGGELLYRPLDGLPWPLAAAAYSALLIVLLTVVQLPISLWSGHVRERRWELSTQTLTGWLADWLKGLGVGVVLSGLALVGLVALARWLPEAWPLPTAGAAAAFVLLLGFVAPVLLEPLFNRFEPLREERLRAELRALAESAGTPVRDVLVSDASRRTRKANAYVSGIGATRRVVVFDTFLEQSRPERIVAVVAHELAHRREQHVAKLTLLGMAGAAAAVVVLWRVLAEGAGDPSRLPDVLLVLTLLQLVSTPAFAFLSRRWERVADRIALELTRDPEAVEGAFRDLAASNVADLDPPRLVHALLASHPTIPERIARARRFATVRA
jgi:STE24 endopeptidase